MTPHSDVTLTNIANSLGVLSVFLIIAYQVVEVISKRQPLAAAAVAKTQ